MINGHGKSMSVFCFYSLNPQTIERKIFIINWSIFILVRYGFSKNEKDNLDKYELKYFKKLAKDLLAIENSEYERLISLGNFKIIEEKWMRKSIKNAIGSTIQDLINSGEKTSFTAKELNLFWYWNSKSRIKCKRYTTH